MSSFLSKESISEIEDSFSIHSLEQGNISNYRIYFDTYDVIDIIRGIWAFELYHKFDYERFKNELSVLVHSFAFKGLYGPIHMLPPHQDELASKLLDGNMANAWKVDQHYTRVENEFLSHLGLEKILDDIDASKTQTVLKTYFESVKSRADEIFKADLLLWKPHWVERFKYLRNNNILTLERKDYKIHQIIKTQTFKKIKKAFDIARQRDSFQKSNYVDALSLYFLQQELEKYKKSRRYSTEYPLPVFYTSSNGIHRAFEILRDYDKELFRYKFNGRLVPVIRDSTYFMLHPVFRNEPNSNIEDVFSKNLKEKSEEIMKIIQGKYKNYIIFKSVGFSELLEEKWKDFENGIKEVIHIEFIKNIWFEEKGYPSLNASLKRFKEYRDKLDKLDEYVDEEGKKAIEKLKDDYNRANLLTKIFNTFAVFKNRSGNTESILTDWMCTVISDLPGLPLKRKCPRIQSTFINLINSLEEGDERNEFRHRISELATFLYEEPVDAESRDNLVVGFVILWILEKYELIAEIGSNIRPDYPRYELALIHAAALGMLEAKQARKIPEVIDCIYSKQKNNYKVWIGKAYAYFRIWEKLRDDVPPLPERTTKADWQRLLQSEEYSKYCMVAVEFAKKAVDYLKEEKDRDLSKQDERRRHYLYILNSYIYYISKTSTPEKFVSIKPKYDEFRECIKYQKHWQGRFYDTLSWYNLRRAILEHKKEYLEMARYYNAKALGMIATPRDEGIYQRLKELIPEVDTELFS